MQQPPTHQPSDQSSAVMYRVELLAQKLDIHEQTLSEIKQQFTNFVRVRENELLLLNLQNKVTKVELDIVDNKHELEAIKTKMQIEDIAAQRRQSQLQIDVLKWAVGLAVTIGLLFLAAYATHIIH
jgi:hypothetical protein